MKSFKDYREQIGEIGVVEAVTKSTVGVSGLPTVCPGERVLFESGLAGQVLFLEPESVQVLLLGEDEVKSGTTVVRTKEKIRVPVGEELLGQVVDPLGQTLDWQKSNQRPRQWRPLTKDSPGIEQRMSVCKPLETGVAVVDVLVPLGCGQRELVIGDRKTGKTSFLLQAVLNQAQKGMICIWTLIGKRKSEVKEIVNFFSKYKVMDRVVMVAASAQDPTGLIYLAPYAALTMAEYFRDQGQDSLVVLDDLTIHARFYRELSLLAKRFPGRDSYPVDIFFAHAALLEKGGNFKTKKGEVSITVMPVAQTTQGDLSGYIQTNLMSMTDGHIYFDKDLFAQGRRPAINPFLSVTRVGRQTQTSLGRHFSRELMAFLTHFQKLESYVHFGAELTDEVKAELAKGERLLHFFDQKPSVLIPANLAFYLLACLWQDQSRRQDLLIAKYFQNKKWRQEVDQTIEKSRKLESLLKKVKK